MASVIVGSAMAALTALTGVAFLPLVEVGRAAHVDRGDHHTTGYPAPKRGRFVKTITPESNNDTAIPQDSSPTIQ